MPGPDEGLEQHSGTKVILLMVIVFFGGLLWTLRTGQQTVLQTHVLATLILVAPAFLLAHSDNKYLVPYLVLVWAISPEVRRIVDWMQGEYHPRSLISVAPIAATMALSVPVTRQRIVVPQILYKALASLALAMAYAGFVGYIRNELPAVFELAGTVAPFAILLYAAGRPNIPGERDFWVLSIVYIALGVAAYGLIQYVYAPAWDTMWMRAVSREFIAIGRPEPYEIRVFSTFGSPLQASLFLLTALIPMLVEPKWRRGISYPGAAFIGYVLLLTITRTAWVALAAGVLAYLIIAKGARKIHAIMATVLVTAVVWFSLPYLPGYETISDRLTSMTALKTDTSMTARQGIAQMIWDAWKDNPIGTGMGSFGVGTRLSSDPSKANTGFDNGYIGLMLSYGWVGMLFFMRGLWLLLRSVRAYSIDPDREPYTRLAVAFMVAYAVYTGSAYGAGVFVLLLVIALPFGISKPVAEVEPEPLFVDAARPLRRRLGPTEPIRTRAPR